MIRSLRMDVDTRSEQGLYITPNCRSSLTTAHRYDPWWSLSAWYLLSGEDVDTPAVTGRPRALLREEVPTGVTLRDEHTDGYGDR